MRQTLGAYGLIAAVVALGLTRPAQAAELWDEVADGDLADTVWFSASFPFTGQTPTTVGALTAGANNLLGASTASPLDYDGFFFTVPGGEQLTQFTVDLDRRTFLRVTDGAGNPLNNFGTEPALNNANTSITFDILSFMTATTLNAGTYAVLLRNGAGDTSTLNYEFHFTLTPEPGAGLLLAAGVAGMVLCRRGT